MPTTLAFVRLVDGQATYLFYDENTAGRMLFEEDLPAISDDVEAMHFPCVQPHPEPCGSTYEALMKREHGERVMMFDPNIRKNLIKDKPSHLARMKRMLAYAHIVNCRTRISTGSARAAAWTKSQERAGSTSGRS